MAQRTTQSLLAALVVCGAGATFTPVRLTPDDHPPLGDVSLAFDDRGRLFLSYLAIQKNGLPGYWGRGTGGNGIWVLRSPDGGKTWDPAPVGVKVWKGDEPDVKLEDMPRIWSDTGATSPHRGNLYMAWIEWQLEQSIILFTRSSDGGQTWATPMRISTRAGLPRDDNDAVVGPIGTVAPLTARFTSSGTQGSTSRWQSRRTAAGALSPRARSSTSRPPISVAPAAFQAPRGAWVFRRSVSIRSSAGST
jgi:hypothetical protein